jgi:AraC-like DNA-binding protein
MARPLSPPPGFLAPHTGRGRYVFPAAGPPKSAALVCAGWEECHPRFVVDRPSFRWHAIELLATGDWRVRTGQRWVPARAGTVVYYGPDKAGGIRAEGTGPHTKYFADFGGSGAARWLEGAALRKTPVRFLADPRRVVDLYEQILSCRELPRRQQGAVGGLLLRALLLRLGADRAVPAERPSTRRRRVFERCRHYLVENHTRIRTIGEAARACRIGPEYFSRIFREQTGQTASRFLARLRMEHAANLLQRSDLTVRAVGRAVGFEDAYHFSRVFKRVHGIAPSRFANRR